MQFKVEMKVYLLTLVSVLALHSSLALKNLEDPRWKSFDDAELECANYLFISNKTLHRYHGSGYPNEPSVWMLVNCVLVNLNAWDEDRQEVKDYVFSQFFVPSTTDCQYKEHTQECLDQNVAPLNQTARLGRAYQTFQCYYQHYAGISDEVKWVPYRFSEIVQINADCMRIENFSPESLLDFCKGRIRSNPDYSTHAYCFFVRNGMYSKSTGMDLEKMYVQFGAKPLLQEHTEQCVAEVKEQYCKEPERVGHMLLDCLIQYLPAALDIGTAASEVLGNPPECVIPPNPPPKTQPCYNAPCD